MFENTREELVERIVKEIGEARAKELLSEMVTQGYRAMANQYSPGCLELQMLDVCKDEMIKAVNET